MNNGSKDERLQIQKRHAVQVVSEIPLCGMLVDFLIYIFGFDRRNSRPEQGRQVKKF